MNQTLKTNDNRRDQRSGRFEEEFSDEDFVRAVNKLGGAGTSDVAEHIGCDHNTAYKRLRKLRDLGRVESEQVGNSLRWETTNDDIRSAILNELQARQVAKTSILADALDGYGEGEIRDELYKMVDDGVVEQIPAESEDEIWELLD